VFDSIQNFQVHRFKYFNSPVSPLFDPFKRVLQLQQTWRILRHMFERGRYDIIEVGTVFPGAVVAQTLRQRRDFSLISYALGDDVLRPLTTWYAASIFSRVLKRIDFFVSISRFTKGVLVKAGIPPERIVIIKPSIDQERFGRQGDGVSIRARLPAHDLILLTVCNLTEKKGVDRVIEVMPRLKKRFPGLLYVVGGSGADLPRLQKLAYENKVADRVIFLGRVPSESMVDVYASANVFIMPTRLDLRQGSVEGFGIVFLEAGAQGVPVIGPNEGGSADAIIDGVTGYLVNPNDHQDIENRIIELLNNPALRRRLGEAGKKQAFEHRDWSPLLNLR
jgi:phosphatidylinositol alpha-1,6-mannosyltransferase